jgi:uncharacterized repeat protein (TIGR01451 family)
VASSSLTGIFAPGSPALAESLRTLVVEPGRTLAPGETIRVSFSFSNLGGAAATGVRVRFSHPLGVEHVAGADVVDDQALPEGESFINPGGGSIGALEPNTQRRVTCTFRVNDTIEDGSELLFQAALATDQTPLVGSNIERLTVRSRPELQNTSTFVAITSPTQPKPGDVITVRATVRNNGSSSAHDVVLVMPAPQHTHYIARSARIDGRVVAGIEGEAFDYDGGTILSERLAPGQSVIAEYQATIDSPLADGTKIRAEGTVGSRECSEFDIRSSEIVVSSPVDFSDEDTAFTVLSDDVVTPGTRIPMTLRALNAGTGIAERVQISFSLPDGLVYAPGSATIDGQPLADESIADLTFSLGSLAAGRTVEVGIAATVAVPAQGRTDLPIGATLRWNPTRALGAERSFSRRLSVRVAPRFSRARNFVEADRGVAKARDDVKFLVHVFNDGTAPDENVRMRLTPGLYLTDVRVGESDDEVVPYDEPLPLGVVAPHEERVFVVHATIASRVPDRSTVMLGVLLEQREGAVDLGAASIVVRSRPTVESVAWELVSSGPLRPNRTIDVLVRVTNSGSDVLRDARLSLTLPPELVLERAVDARRESEGLAFVDVPAETTHEARVTLRLSRAVSANRTLALEGWLHGKGISPVQFPALEVPTFAEAQFAGSTSIIAIPSETVNAGERLYYEVRMRNEGDGPAERLTVRVVPTNLAVYVPSSTTVNGMPLADDAGASQLWAARGLVLADVDPHVDVRIRWEMMVMTPLAAGTGLDTRAVLEWDDGTTHAVAAPTVRVQAQPSLSETTAGTPISIARTFHAEEPPVLAPAPIESTPETAALVASAVPQPLAPAAATPVVEPPRSIAELVAEHAERLEAPPAPAALPQPTATSAEFPTPFLYVDFNAERLSHTLRMLERSESAGGLVQHLFAMRMLFPENAIGGAPELGTIFSNSSRALRAPLEKLFVRLRMPRLTLTGKDLEDRDSRDALRTLLEVLSFAPSAPPQGPPAGLVRVGGAIELDVVRSLIPELDASPLGSAIPWLINAQLLGSTIYRDGERADGLEHYRTELLGVLTVLNELPIEEFHRVLIASVNRTLDEALAVVMNDLRGAARIAAE